MIWCLSLTILSLVISQGADGEPDPPGIVTSVTLGCDCSPPRGLSVRIGDWLAGASSERLGGPSCHAKS